VQVLLLETTSLKNPYFFYASIHALSIAKVSNYIFAVSREVAVLVV